MKTKKINFKNPSSRTIFQLCMNFVGGWELTEDVEIDINRESFRDLLAKYDLQLYIDLLIDYQLRWLDIQKVLDRRRTNFDDNKENVLPYKLKVARIMKIFLSGEQANFKNIEVSVSDLTEKIKIADNKLFDQLKEVFTNEFKKIGLDETIYTKEEVIEEIKNEEDIDYDWLFDNGYDFEEIQTQPDLVDEYFIERYRKEHFKQREISLELVNNVIEELETWQNEIKGNVGARLRNLEIGVLARELSILRRTHIFLNQKRNTSFNNITLSRETCRFIYSYFEFWNLLPKKIDYDELEKDNRAKYIDSLIKNYEKSIESSNINPVRDVVIHNSDLELRINLFKKVKDGILTPDQFYERFPYCIYW